MNFLRRFVWSCAITLPLVVVSKAQAANTFPGVGTVDYDATSNVLTVEVSYLGKNPFHVQWLDGSQKLVVDVDGLNVPSNRALYIGMGVVEQIRAAHQRSGSTRLIFDVTQAADVKVVTNQTTHKLQLTVFPRGMAPVTSAARPNMLPHHPPASPRSQSPYRPRMDSVPTARITPVPVPQASFEPITVPEAAVKPQTPPPITEAPTPVPLPTIVPTPGPMTVPSPSTEPSTESMASGQPMIFGNRLYAGADLPFMFKETAAVSDTSVGFNLGGNFGLEHMFTQNLGVAVGGHAMSYTIQDAQAGNEDLPSRYTITHKRGDYEGSLGLRGRFPLGSGLELFAQPGVGLRMVTVDNTVQPLDGDGEPKGEPVAAEDFGESYLTSGWMGYGPNLQFGAGYAFAPPFSVVGLGEVNYLFGSMNQSSVASIFPLLGLRAGLEARADFGPVGGALGYSFSMYSHDDLSQMWTGPYLKVSFVY